MYSSLTGSVPPYIGVDLTDRYAIGCKAIDVCGLSPGTGAGLTASFWSWQWDPAPQRLSMSPIIKELNASKVAMVDGPQGLAEIGCTLRACERQGAAVGKTPHERPAIGKPFAGFVCSSLDLFGAFSRVDS
jgi:hypothetical protein